jgi:hypothetical protein
VNDGKVHVIDFIAVCGVKVRPDVFEVLSESRKVDGGSGKSLMLLVISDVFLDSPVWIVS